MKTKRFEVKITLQDNTVETTYQEIQRYITKYLILQSDETVEVKEID